MAQIRLLHLSDLHFSVEPRRLDAYARLRKSIADRDILRALFRLRANSLFASYDQDLALAIAEFVYARRDSFDAIVITGDLSTTGTIGDLTQSLAFLTAVPVRGVRAGTGAPTLAGSGLEYFIIPGNHDRYANIVGGAGGKEFDTVFAQLWQPQKRVQIATISTENERLALVGADFSLLNEHDAQLPFGHLGQGRVYRDVLRDLEQSTRELKEADGRTAILWIVHFPPEAPGIAPTMQLLDGRDLISAARACEVSYILAGHIHTDITYRIPGHPPVSILCADTACSMSPNGGNGFQILEIECVRGQMSLTEQNYAWDEDRGEFIRA